MHKKILLRVLEKIKEETLKDKGVPISNTQAFERISEYLKDDCGVGYGAKSLELVYKGNSEIKKEDVIQGLCNYLGYKNYIDFKTKNQAVIEDQIRKKEVEEDVIIEEKKTTVRKFLDYLDKRKLKLISTILLLFLISIFIYYEFQKKRWMVWDKDHYVEVKFNDEKYELGQLKLYKKERIKYFKKVQPNSKLQYHDKKGAPKIWYGKNAKGELELFTSYGLHPETGKTLKPITYYMINKYFCNDNSLIK